MRQSSACWAHCSGTLNGQAKPNSSRSPTRVAVSAPWEVGTAPHGPHAQEAGVGSQDSDGECGSPHLEPQPLGPVSTLRALLLLGERSSLFLKCEVVTSE